MLTKPKKVELTEEGLSPYRRPIMQNLLEKAVSATVKQLNITSEQRDQHRVYRSLIRMSCRVGIYMGYDLKEHVELVVELYTKCKADLEQKKLPACAKSSKPEFSKSMMKP